MKRHQKASVPRAVRLFAEPARLAEAYIAEIDGASRGNPGPASYAVILRRPDGQILDRVSKAIGQSTNNVAEYYALIAALDYAHAHGILKLRVRSDSELLVHQMHGHYRVKSLALRQLHERARKLAQGLADFSIEHVPREQNREADRLADQALDRTEAASEAHWTVGEGISERQHETRKAKFEKQAIRARYHKGTLHPAEPLHLEEGTEVEITIRKLPGH